MPLFLGDDDMSRRRLAEVAGRITGMVQRWGPSPGPRSNADPARLATLVEAIDVCPDDGVALDQVLDEVGSSVVAHGVRPTDPWCAAHLHCPPLLTAAATELAIGATNQSMDSFDQAPAATLVEDHLVRWLAGRLGLPTSASGVVTGGGTASNLLGLLLARDHADTTRSDGEAAPAVVTAQGPGPAAPAGRPCPATDSIGYPPAYAVAVTPREITGNAPACASRPADPVHVAAPGPADAVGVVRGLDPVSIVGRAQTAARSVAAEGLPDEARGWRIVTSGAAHFSVERAAAVLGLGRRAVVPVATDEHDRMDLGALDAVLEQLVGNGLRPIALVGTAGTTDAGAIDPLEGMAERAQAHGAWFHVDAAVGGAFCLSEDLRPRLAGIEQADSVTVDFHKLWWQPIGASALVVRDGAALVAAVRHPSDYLDRPDDDGDHDSDDGDPGFNLVARSLDTSRRFDALKVLVSLRHTGRRQLATMLEHLVELAAATAAAVAQHPDLELLAPPSTITVLFRWCGEGHADLDRANTAVQRRLFRAGEAVIGRTRFRSRVALKLTLLNPRATLADMTRLLDLVAATAHEPAPDMAVRTAISGAGSDERGPLPPSIPHEATETVTSCRTEVLSPESVA